MITDDMIQGSIARPPRRHIQNDTPIVPCAVAEAVWQEANLYLRTVPGFFRLKLIRA